MFRTFSKLFFCLSLSTLYSVGKDLSADAALQELVEGNQRFVEDKPQAPYKDQNMRDVTIDGQKPFAIILGCADSRVPPEIIFDQAIGSLFVIRVAGNVNGETEAETIDYGVHFLKAPLIIVLGHQSCGAVEAVISGQAAAIPAIAKLIEPAAKSSQGNLVAAIKDNAKNMVENLMQDTKIAKKVSEGTLKIVPAYYSFQAGQVEFLDK